MRILGIETSTMTGSVALMDEERLIAEYTLNLRETHTSRLMPTIDRVIKDASFTIKDLDGIAVSLGPGSFTGLRIGIATAKGLAQGLNIPVVGIPTLDGLAFNLFNCKDLVSPILDARKGEIYSALYKNGKRLSEYMACEPGRLLKEIKYKVSLGDLESPRDERQSLPRGSRVPSGREAKSKVVFLGDGVEVYGDLIKRRLGRKAIFAPKTRSLPSAASISELGLKRLRRNKKSELLTLKPIYVRAPLGK